MPPSDQTIETWLGDRVKFEREERGWSLTELAAKSGVSRAMINRIERGESSPTAILIGRLSASFGMTVSALLARAERANGDAGYVSRAQNQSVWQDPATGYRRRQVAPVAHSTLPLDLVQVELPAGASITYPASAFAFIRQLVWVLDGALTFIEGSTVHQLGIGDCLELGLPSDCTFQNDSDRACFYAVVVMR